MNKILQAGELKEFKDRKEAEDWSQKDARIWRESILTKDMKKVFEKVLTITPETSLLKSKIQYYLIQFKGNLEIDVNSKEAKDFEKTHNIKIKGLIDQIRLLDYGLKKAVIGEDIILYHSFTQDGFGLMMHEFLQINSLEDMNTIDPDKFENLKAKWLNASLVHVRHDYFFADPINKDLESKHFTAPVYIKVIAPRGSKGVFYTPETTVNETSGRFIFAHNTKFKVIGFKIVESKFKKELIEITIKFL